MRNKILLSLFLALLIIGVQGKFTTVSADPLVDFSYAGICVGSPTYFTVDSTITNAATVANWDWNFGDGTYSTFKNPVHTYAGSGIYPVTLTIKDIFGHIVFVTHFITIQKLPVPNFEFTAPDCSIDSIQFTDLSNPETGYISARIWNFDDGSVVDTIFFPGDPNPKHVFPNPGTFNVTLSVMNTDMCVNQVSLPVTVPSNPVADFFSMGECEDQLVKFKDVSSPNGAVNIVDWDWNFGDPTSGINNVSNTKDPSHTFNNDGTYSVKLVVTNFNGCTDTLLKQVVINPHPLVEFTHTIICLGEPVFFNPDPSITNLPSIASWQWDFGDGNMSYASNPDHAYWVSGDYPVTLTVTDILGCKNEVTHTVKVNPLPVAQFSTNMSYCAGAEVQFHDMSSTSPFTGYVDRWEWDFGDGNTIVINHPGNPDVSHSYALPGTYTVTLTVKSSEGCTDTGTHLLIIHSNPVANFTSTAACEGKSVDLTDLTELNGASSIMQWQWDFGDPGSGVWNISSLQNPDHSFTVAGNPIVQLIVISGDGCSDTIARPVLVNPPPPVDFNTIHSCQNSIVIFTPDAVVMNLASINSWFWDFGNGFTSTLQNPTNIYTTAGNFNIKLTVVDSTGCTNTITRPITIIPQPTANFSYLQPSCNNSPVQFNNLSNTVSGIIVRSDWDFGDGNMQSVNTLASVSHTYSAKGTYFVILTVTTSDSCTKSVTLPVVVLSDPLADFSFLNTCMNSPVQFDDLTQPGAGGLTSWSWNFDDNISGAANFSSIQEPTHTYNSAGTFQVTLIVENTVGCKDTIVKPLLVKGLPAVDFTSLPACVNNSTQFVSSTFVNAGAIVSRIWNFGDGVTSNDIDPGHIYTSSGHFNVTLTVTDTAGCINTKIHTVDTAPLPVSFFQVTTQACINSTLVFTNFSTPSSGILTSFYWEFGDGSDILILAPANGNITHHYIAAGNYAASLTVHNSLGCAVKSQRIITVSASPIAQFKFDNSCESVAVNYTDFSQANSGTSLVKWNWNFGDPLSLPNNTSDQKEPSHTYNSPGTYMVSLLIENATGCKDSISEAVVIKPKPTVDFSGTNTCLGNPTSFTINTIVTNVGAVVSYDWNFGDGTAHNTSQQNPFHLYTVAGNYTVTLTIVNTSGCKNLVSHTVSVSSPPDALFSYVIGCPGASTSFTDQSFAIGSYPIIAWHWDFGITTALNDTSNEQNPSWKYTKPGIYIVTLVVTAQGGCQDITTHTVHIFANPVADFNYTASPCENGVVNFMNSSYSQQATIVASNWEFEPDNYSNLKNPAYVFYATDSCYDVRLIVKDIRGCIDTVVKEVCVPAEFDITFTTSPACFKDSTYFTPQLVAPLSGSLVSFKWNFGDDASGINNTSTKPLPSHYYAQPGTYTISLEATDINNCNKTIYKNITIFPLPVVPMFTYTKGICDSTIYFNESSAGNGSTISSWTWDFGDGITNTVYAPNSPNLSHHYKAPGTYTVGLKVTNANGCSNSVVESNIVVSPCLHAAFELLENKVCQNNTLTFIDNSYSSLTANERYWDFGDGTNTTYVTNTNRVDHVYKSPGTFTVRMILSTIVTGKIISDTAQMIVNVNPTPIPDFTFGAVCHEQKVVFTNMTSGTGTKVIKYNWTFGEPASAPNDTSTLKNPDHLYNAPGTYQIQLTAENIIGCKDSIQKLLTVNGLPDVNFKSALSCVGYPTDFTDLSIKAGAPLVTWKWTFNDNNGPLGEKDVQNPRFVFRKYGDYHVNLKVTDANGCSNSINQDVSTWDTPISTFTFSDNIDDVQGQLQFNNSSVDATNYHWTFGNGDDSYAENPIITYPDEGSYIISLVALNDHGCSDTISMQYDFMVKGLYIPNAFSPLNPMEAVRLLKPVGINLQEYRLEVYDRWGTLLWWTDKLDSAGRPTEGWDGKFKDVLQPEGAYMWKAFGIFKDGHIWEAENIGESKNLPSYKTGTATMIR